MAVYGLRLIQDYVVGPKVLGHAVGLSPLIVLVTVSSIGLLFGGFYVLLATPFAAVLATLSTWRCSTRIRRRRRCRS